MVKVNSNYSLLPGSYLFSEVAKRASAYSGSRPLLKLGIGDVTRPLAPCVIEALHKAVDEQAEAAKFRGYGPEQGYDFLTSAIAQHEYATRGVEIARDEIFIGDGSKSDTANFQELFDMDNVVALPDPVYPVYVDSNAMTGRAGVYENGRWSKIVYLPCTAGNGYKPELPDRKVDLIYLCFPNNPTGSVLAKEELERWVDYARQNDCIILYDAAYRQYITRPEIPRSIYEIDGADEVAVEFCSFSKTAGFTGLRCSWTVVPKRLKAGGASLNAMWNRRHSTKFNGTAYIVQRAAEAIYTPQGREQIAGIVEGYMKNAQVIREALLSAGIPVSGGVDAPYIWFPTGKLDSWAFFDKLLGEAGVVGTPGAGFGPSGEGHFRLTAFGDPGATREAMERIVKIL